MPYDAIAIDTQTVERNGFHFEGGLLEQLRQFKSGPTQLVISEIAVREIYKHLVEKTRVAREAFGSAQRKALEYGIIAQDNVTIDVSEVEIEAVVRKRLNKFLNDVGATIVKADDVSTKELVKRYFGSIPPFSPSGKKKNEFPDAIALLSLERWADENDKKMLAISGDKDWASFAEHSPSIDSVADLSEGLALLQQHVAEAEAVVQQLLSAIDSGANSELSQQLTARLSDEVSGYSIGADADSTLEIEVEQVDLTLSDHTLLRDTDGFEFIIVQNREDYIVARVEIELQVHAEAVFGFSIHDSIDDDYVGMGSAQAETEDTFEASILVTFEGNRAEMEFEISKVEIVKAPGTIDFGFVQPFSEPDYEPDYEPPGEDDQRQNSSDSSDAPDRPQPEPPTL